MSCGIRIWGHSGSIPGYLTFMVTTPDAGKRLQLCATSAPTDGNPAHGAVIDAVFCYQVDMDL